MPHEAHSAGFFPISLQICGANQFGSGMNGGETAFAHLYIKLCFEICHINKCSASFVFLDVVSAFAVLLRRILFTEFDTDEAWLRKLHDN